jgi:hypothetical protein
MMTGTGRKLGRMASLGLEKVWTVHGVNARDASMADTSLGASSRVGEAPIQDGEDIINSTGGELAHSAIFTFWQCIWVVMTQQNQMILLLHSF